MNERGIEIKVGILITICLALLVTFIILLGDFSMGGGSQIYLDVDTSADLKPGAPVKIAGVPAGKVTDVEYLGGELDESVGRRVYVRATLTIDEPLLPTLREDARFYITTMGVLGEKYVEIDPGTYERKALGPGDKVEGVPPLRLQILAANASDLIKRLSKLIRDNEGNLNSMLGGAAEAVGNANEALKTVRRTTDRVDKLIARNEKKIDAIIDDVLTIEDQTKTLLTSANTALGDGTAVRRTLANTEAISADVRRQIKPVVADVRGTLAKYGNLADSLDGVVDDAHKTIGGAIEDARLVMADVKHMTANLKNGKGTIGALLSDKEMYDDIREMMKDLKRHPWKFLWKE